MSVILVVEQDRSYASHITDVLQSGGWPARIVVDRVEAERSAAAAPPLLLIVDGTMPGASALLAPFSRRRGGPGTVVLVPQALSERFDAAHFQADEMLPKPFSDDDLTAIVGRCLRTGSEEAAPSPGEPPVDDSQQLTSEDIFADVLAEVEAEARGRRSADPPAPTPAATPVASPPTPTRPKPDLDLAALTATGVGKPARRSTPRRDDDLERKLEETLSGVLGLGSKPRRKVPPPAPPQASPPSAAPIQGTPAPAPPSRTAPPQAAPPQGAPPQPAASAPAFGGSRDRPGPKTPPATPPSARAESDTKDIDDLLDKTLGSLVMPRRSRAARAPEPVPPAADALPPEPAPEPPARSRRADPNAELDALLRGTGDAARKPEAPPLATPPAPAPTPFDAPAPPATPPAVEPVAADENPFAALDVLSELDIPPPTTPEAEDAPPPAFPEAPQSSADEAAAEEATPFQTRSVPQLPPDEGEAFGDYTLLERIAVGGMAEVWKARRRGVEGFQKTVAIKRILAHLGTAPDFVSMFIDEAKLAAQLNHNNIIQIYDLGKVGEDFFIAMEYVDGRDLRTILTAARRRGEIVPPGLAVLIASLLARALDYAHRKRGFDDRELGLVHRDVSPQNVLISYEGEIKLCDFGIVKAVAKASTTQMGALKGKLQYMSPEQAWGKSVDGRSDIFSLGSVLYETLTGNKLFAGESEIGVLDAVRECRIVSPREAVPSLSEEIERVVLKALAKTPEERYQTAGELARDLESVLVDLQPSAGQAGLASYMSKLFRTPLPEGVEDKPAAEKVAAPPLAAATDSLGEGAANDTQAALEPTAQEGTAARPTPGKGRWIAAAVLALLVVGAIIAWLVTRDRGSQVEPSTLAAPDAALPTPPTGTTDVPEPSLEASPPEDGEPAPDDATDGEATDQGAAQMPSDLDLEKMVEEEFARRAQKLQKDFDSERQRLEAELAEARQAAMAPVEETATADAGTEPPAASDAAAAEAGSIPPPSAPPPSGGNGPDTQ